MTTTERAIDEAAKAVRLSIGEVLAFNGVLHVDEIEARIATAITAAVAKACEPYSPGVRLIAAERQRQIEVEGWTESHDDGHDWCQLPLAAVAYAMEATAEERDTDIIEKVVGLVWPWEEKWWKPSDNPIRNLEKAGALIAAEIDRLQRAALNQEQPPCQPT